MAGEVASQLPQRLLLLLVPLVLPCIVLAAPAPAPAPTPTPGSAARPPRAATVFNTTTYQGTVEAAYIYGYASVDMYSILYSYALDPDSPEFKAPLNQIGHARSLATPDDTAVIAPNVDTPYSYAWLDLRAEPVVVTLPAFSGARYMSMQLNDLYTYIVGYVSPRTDGSGGGDFMVAGPGWEGPRPPGVKRVFRPATELALALVRTQLMGPRDLAKVHALQDSVRVRVLSEFLGRVPPPPAPPLPPLVPPVNLRRQPSSQRFFSVLAWVLPLMPPLPGEAPLRRALGAVGVGGGAPFAAPPPERRQQLLDGMATGLAEIERRAAGARSSAELFGTYDFLGQDHLTRAAAALLGILGNAQEEYLGVGYPADSRGLPFDGSRGDYLIRFAPGGLPPVGAFWSITAYTARRLLYGNPAGRHVISSAVVPGLAKDADGGITLYVQNAAPGGAKDANWLPVPDGPFVLTFRTYLPGEAIRNGTWKAPPVVRVGS